MKFAISIYIVLLLAMSARAEDVLIAGYAETESSSFDPIPTAVVLLDPNHQQNKHYTSYIGYLKFLRVSDWFGIQYGFTAHSDGRFNFTPSPVFTYKDFAYLSIDPLYIGTEKFQRYDLGIINGFAMSLRVNVYNRAHIYGRLEDYRFISTSTKHFSSTRMSSMGFTESFSVGLGWEL